MGEVKQIDIKNGTYYFYNDIIDLKNFKSNLLKIDKKIIPLKFHNMTITIRSAFEEDMFEVWDFDYWYLKWIHQEKRWNG